MIELPEAVVIAQQITDTLKGKRIARAVANASPHKFAWYTGDPAEYNSRLAGKTVANAEALGCYIETRANNMVLSISAPIKYHAAGEKRPKKHQILVEFEDGTAISSCAQMWGGFLCFPVGNPAGFPDADIARRRPSPLTEAFDRAYFDQLFDEETQALSAKAFLATQQRIPGLGNGVLQNILWTARIHPKRKMADLSRKDIDAMFAAVKSVLWEMVAKGGRDTERDLFDQPGGYMTILSKNTVDQPCPACGTIIVKEPYMGGSIYVCEGCQKL
jgi:formamidopyrimidine-DNA glycosylase